VTSVTFFVGGLPMKKLIKELSGCLALQENYEK